jgi:hypothetical protein
MKCALVDIYAPHEDQKVVCRLIKLIAYDFEGATELVFAAARHHRQTFGVHIRGEFRYVVE